MDGSTTPTAVMELISYDCKGTCSSGVFLDSRIDFHVLKPAALGISVSIVSIMTLNDDDDSN